MKAQRRDVLERLTDVCRGAVCSQLLPNKHIKDALSEVISMGPMVQSLHLNSQKSSLLNFTV